MSESESHSEADSGNEEGKRWRDGSRRDSIESANHDDRPTAEVAAATTQRTPRGRKRSRLEQLLENGQGNGGNRRNRLCDSRLVRGNSKDSPLESSNQTEQESITGSSTSAVTPNASERARINRAVLYFCLLPVSCSVVFCSQFVQRRTRGWHK